MLSNFIGGNILGIIFYLSTRNIFTGYYFPLFLWLFSFGVMYGEKRSEQFRMFVSLCGIGASYAILYTFDRK